MVSEKLKDFPIMFSYFCENISKEKNIYTFTLREWEHRYIIIGTFSIQANNKQDLKDIILRKMREAI